MPSSLRASIGVPWTSVSVTHTRHVHEDGVLITRDRHTRGRRRLVARYHTRPGQRLRLDLDAVEVSIQDLGIYVVVVLSLTLRQTVI